MELRNVDINSIFIIWIDWKPGRHHHHQHQQRGAMAGVIDLDQNKILETALKKVKEQAFYMKHAMVRYVDLIPSVDWVGLQSLP